MAAISHTWATTPSSIGRLTSRHQSSVSFGACEDHTSQSSLQPSTAPRVEAFDSVMIEIHANPKSQGPGEVQNGADALHSASSHAQCMERSFQNNSEKPSIWFVSDPSTWIQYP